MEIMECAWVGGGGGRISAQDRVRMVSGGALGEQAPGEGSGWAPTLAWLLVHVGEFQMPPGDGSSLGAS